MSYQLSPQVAALAAKTVADQARVCVLAQVMVETSAQLLLDLRADALLDRLRADAVLAKTVTDVRLALTHANSELLAAVQDGTLTHEHITALEAAQLAALHFLEEVQPRA